MIGTTFHLSVLYLKLFHELDKGISWNPRDWNFASFIWKPTRKCSIKVGLTVQAFSCARTFFWLSELSSYMWVLITFIFKKIIYLASVKPFTQCRANPGVKLGQIVKKCWKLFWQPCFTTVFSLPMTIFRWSWELKCTLKVTLN